MSDRITRPGSQRGSIGTDATSSAAVGTAIGGVGLRAPERLPRVLLAILLVGTGFRLAHYLLRRSLWLDEARLALDIATQSWTELLEPLPYDQSAPLMFLVGVKALTMVFGVNEWAFRALPLAAGIGVVWLIYPVARQFVVPGAAAIAAAIAAISPSMIFFSNEAKQYSSDALSTVVLIALAAAWQDRPEERGRWLRLTVAGAILVWLSAPAFLVLAGLGCALLLTNTAGSKGVGRLLVTGTVWIVSFAVAYLVIYQPASRNPYLRDYWASAMLVPGAPDLLERVWLVARTVVWGVPFGHLGPLYWSPVESLMISPMTVVLLLLLLIGARHLVQHRRPKAALVLAPLAMALGASVLGAYPFALRLSLFTSGLLLILLAAGIERMVEEATSSRRARVYAGFAALLLAFPATHLLPDLLRWRSPEHSRPLIRRYQAQAGSDPIYVHSGVLPAWAFYTTDWAAPDTARLSFLERIGSSGGAAFENAPSRGHAVIGEGSELVRLYQGRKEILGVHIGMQVPAFVDHDTLRADPGWTDHEIKRIRSEADSVIWVLMSHRWPRGPEERFLSEMAAESVSEDTWFERGAMMVRYRLR